jgi:hypothetical protein
MKTKRVAYAMVAVIVAAAGYAMTLTSSLSAAAQTGTGSVQVANLAPADAQTTTFTFTITCPGATGSPFTRTVTGSATTTPVAGIPVGTACSARETPVAGFTVQADQSFPPVTASATQSVTFTNTRTAGRPNADLGVTATAPSGAGTPVSIVLQVSDPNTADPNMNNNTTAVTVSGSQVPITARITNNGPDATTQGTLVLTTTLPSGVSLVSASGGGFACTTSGQTVTCSRTASLAPGASVDLVLVVSIGNAGGSSGFDPYGIVRQCLATCSVENNRQESSQTVNLPGAPQTERDRDRAERDADRAADRGGTTADPTSGALAASGTRAQAAAASPAASTGRIPFTGAPVQRLALSALVLLIFASMLRSNARSASALEGVSSPRPRWRHRRGRHTRR